MTGIKLLNKVFGGILIILFLAGCASSSPTPVPLVPVQPPPNPLPIPTPALPVQSIGRPDIFNYIQTVQVTPDEKYLSAAFARINYVPARDQFVVTFGGTLAQDLPDCGEKVFSYKLYTLDMQATGESGTFSCDPFDAGSVMVDNTYYFAAMAKDSGQDGWHLLKIDAVNWNILVDYFFPLTTAPQAGNADPMVAYVNGQIDVSSQYNDNSTGAPPADITGGAATHHHFFSSDLSLIEEKIISDPPNIVGSSMIYLDGIYYFITANGFLGDVVVMEFDQNWQYLGGKILIEDAHWSTGLAFDGGRYYLAYMDTSQRLHPDNLPVFLNVHLAAFDRDWNLIEDIAVTNYKPAEGFQPGRPWVLLHGNRLYVSYDLDTMDPITYEEKLFWQSFVEVYELTPGP